jgi:Holliday junction resolvase
VSGASHRRKGDRLERDFVKRHQSMGVCAERYPLSGASRFRGSGHDIDIYAFGRGAAPLAAEVKGRKKGNGFSIIENWLGAYDALFLRRNNAEPLVVLPWRIWVRLLEEVRPTSSSNTSPSPREQRSLRPRQAQKQTKNRTPKRCQSVCGRYMTAAST